MEAYVMDNDTNVLKEIQLSSHETENRSKHHKDTPFPKFKSSSTRVRKILVTGFMDDNKPQMKLEEVTASTPYAPNNSFISESSKENKYLDFILLDHKL